MARRQEVCSIGSFPDHPGSADKTKLTRRRRKSRLDPTRAGARAGRPAARRPRARPGSDSVCMACAAISQRRLGGHRGHSSVVQTTAANHRHALPSAMRPPRSDRTKEPRGGRSFGLLSASCRRQTCEGIRAGPRDHPSDAPGLVRALGAQSGALTSAPRPAPPGEISAPAPRAPWRPGPRPA